MSSRGLDYNLIADELALEADDNWSDPEGSYIHWLLRYILDGDNREKLIDETDTALIDAFEVKDDVVESVCDWLRLYNVG